MSRKDPFWKYAYWKDGENFPRCKFWKYAYINYFLFFLIKKCFARKAYALPLDKQKPRLTPSPFKKLIDIYTIMMKVLFLLANALFIWWWLPLIPGLLWSLSCICTSMTEISVQYRNQGKTKPLILTRCYSRGRQAGS